MVSLVLAAAGLYGVMVQFVDERMHEIGVRLALGARPVDAALLVLKQAGILVASGVAAGALAALAGVQTLRGLLFGIAPIDPASFAIATVVFFVVATAAVLIPISRAARVDIAEVLRID